MIYCGKEFIETTDNYAGKNIMLSTLLQAIQIIIEDIVEKYRSYMKTIALRIIKDEYLAEGIVQDALIKINQNISKMDSVDSRRTKNFIITITRNTAFTMLRQRKNIEEHVQFLSDEEFNSIEGEIDISAFCDQYGFSPEVSNALSSIGEVDKDILVLRYGMGYRCREIAKLLEMSEDSVYKRCQRARKSLQQSMKGEVK